MKKPLVVMAAVMLALQISPTAHAATFTATATATTWNWKGITFFEPASLAAEQPEMTTDQPEMVTEAVGGGVDPEEPIPEELDVSLEEP